MYVYDAEGKKIQASAKDAKEMVASGGYSTRWPKPSPEVELADLKLAEGHEEQRREEDLIRLADAAKAAEQRGLAPAGTVSMAPAEATAQPQPPAPPAPPAPAPQPPTEAPAQPVARRRGGNTPG